MADWQHVPFRYVFNIQRSSVRAQQLESAYQLAFFEKSLPML